MINSVTLVGRITRDPELRKTQSGKSVLSFTLAVNRTFSKEKEADFILCQTWNHSADFISKYVTQGDLLGLTGRIQTRNYDDKQGNRVYITEVIADSVQQLESRKEKEARQSGQEQYKYEPQQEEEEFGGPTLDISSDDLPF